MKGIDDILTRADEEHVLVGVPSMFSFVLGLSKPPLEFRDVVLANMTLYEQIQALMRERGIEFEHDPKEPWFVCEALSDSDVGETLSALEDVLKTIKR